MADAPPNAPNAAVIRPYDPKDEKFAKFTLGKAAFEGLAYANHAGASAPLVRRRKKNAQVLIRVAQYTPIPPRSPSGLRSAARWSNSCTGGPSPRAAS